MKNILILIFALFTFCLNAQTIIADNYVLQPDLLPFHEFVAYDMIVEEGDSSIVDYDTDLLILVDGFWYGVVEYNVRRQVSRENFVKANNGLPRFSKDGKEITEKEYFKGISSKSQLEGITNYEYTINEIPNKQFFEDPFSLPLLKGYIDIDLKTYEALVELYDSVDGDYESYKPVAQSLIKSNNR